ncbi:MAG: threonine synthase [Rhodothermales bacterium]|jgi:threonine synthase
MPVLYQSTRGKADSATGFVEALLGGLASDGGLYVPLDVPALPENWERQETFADLGSLVLRNWLDGALAPAVVDAAARSALSFPVPLVPLQGPWEGVHILELFHGPTLSFKDFGARTMARLMAASIPAGKTLTVLVATSGDTGSAVADGFSGIPGVRVVLLYPEGQVSRTQEQQLIVERPGVTALRVRGTFDDCQRMVKGAFSDPALAGVGLSSANSINIGRLLPQSLYYLWAGIQLQDGRPFRACVPSGNLGNLTAAVLAWRGGLPMSGFVAAHNSNQFFPQYLGGSDAGFGPSVRTMSNAMDVGAPSNFERLEWMLGRETLTSAFQGVSVSDSETLESMRRVYGETGYLADPHTAVGLEAVRRLRSGWADSEPIVVASTAHPAKFPEAILEATGLTPDVPASLAAFWNRKTAVAGIDASGQALRAAILAADVTG